jgi:hypothetical protein
MHSRLRTQHSTWGCCGAQRAFSAAAEKEITFDIDVPYVTHNIDGPDLKVQTTKSTFRVAPLSSLPHPAAGAHRIEPWRVGGRR